ncbi:MAG: ATP-dependent helicase, partial [Candidatus Neomarinimicrobiota bacterium]
MSLLNSGFTPNQAQKRAIEHPPAPLMILAGAGTGKTWTLIQRLVYYITELNIPADTILTITYTEKAAQELSARILEKIGSRAAGIMVSTFHAFCFNIVKKYGYKNHKIPRLMEDGDAVYLLLNHFDSFGPFESKEFPMDPVTAVIKSFIPFFNRIRDEIIDLSAWDNPQEDGILFTSETISQLNDLRRIFPIFQKLKRKQNRVDYGDMISKCHRLINTDPVILSDLALKYRHIIIDEFQDNNFALNEVIGLIADKHGSITVVGDDDQIIYTFRGASAYNIKEFRSRYKRFPDYKEISLEENFRSHFQILQAANEIIAKNRERVSKILKPFKNRTGPLPELIWGNKTEQHEFIVEKIREFGETGSYAYHDMAVLCRTRNQVKDLALTLKNAHIPVTAYLIEYFQIPIIRDLMSWCHLISGSGLADSALYRILEHFLDGRTLFSLFSRFHKRDSESRLILIRKHFDLCSPDLQNQLRVPLQLIDALKAENIIKNGADMVWSICEKTKLIRPYLKNYELNDQIAILNTAEFMEKSQNFSKNHEEDPSLKAFVKYMDTLQNTGSVQTIYPAITQRRAGVLVQTIHGVKGAEFPVVFVPHNQAGSFPLNFNIGKLLDGPPDSWLPYHNATALTAKEGHTQEERRLLYVALTRAKERLFILAPKKRTSKFIRFDLPPHLIKEITMESKIQQMEPRTHAEIRQKYETRLNNALSTAQFNISENMLLRLERLSELEKKRILSWGDSSWEQEMQA